MIWKIRGGHIPLTRTLLMGVLNLTPDSFSDGGNFVDPEKALQHALFLIEQGADILDLGGESTRPGAQPVSIEEELRRVVPLLKKISDKTTIPLSIDTTKPEIARETLKNGAHIINDVSGLRGSGPEMAEAVREFRAGIVLMHRRGNPLSMQGLAHYDDVTAEVLSELEESFNRALESGLEADQIVIDPGLGFAKTAEQNFELIRHLEKFHAFGRPVLLGPSRKAFIGNATGREVGSREFGTAAVVALAVAKGVQILRVHEPGPMRDVVRVAEAIRGENYVRTF